MVPYDALYYYELQLEQAAEAHEHGFETYEEYIESVKDDIGNRQYDEWKENERM